MNKLIDMRTSGHAVDSTRRQHIACTRTAFIHGLMAAGVTDFVRLRVASKILARGVVPVDPEYHLRDQLKNLPVEEAVHLLAGVAARCDFVIDVPSYGEPNEITDMVARAVRHLGLTSFVWPEYGPGGPSMNHDFFEPLEEEACVRVASFQQEPIGYAGVMTGAPANAINFASACPSPMNAVVGQTAEPNGHDHFRTLVDRVKYDVRQERFARRERERRERAKHQSPATNNGGAMHDDGDLIRNAG